MYFEQASVVYSIVRAFAGSRVKTRRCSSRQEDIFEKTCVVYFLNCKAFGGLKDVSRSKKMYFEQTCVFT